MDRSTTIGGNTNPLSDSNPLSSPAANAKVAGAAQTAHQTVDRVADKAASQVDRMSGTAHRAVDGAADVANSAMDWASSVPEQAKQVQTKVTEAASASIRARPITTVLGAVVVGYLLGRLARL